MLPPLLDLIRKSEKSVTVLIDWERIKKKLEKKCKKTGKQVPSEYEDTSD